MLDYIQKYINFLHNNVKKNNNIPISSIIIKNNTIIASSKNDTFWHAEILCIQKAQKKLKNNYLYDCVMICTLEPCSMCLYAIKLAKIHTLIMLSKNTKKINHKLDIIYWQNSGSDKLLTSYFKQVRNS